ncbi:type III pantothenate kinase [Castellaniella sp.]|uniref:type III pantothenate kinase n=1 Tax=Castellaniella sp. TaxID=1955812 RepID=UPI002AFE7EA3|nr:type III pantothenate kinase [Castellaniella sp.]
MMLLIDAGNTRAKFAWQATATSPRTPARTLDYSGLPDLARQAPGRPSQILASNVAGADVAARIQLACHQAWGLPIRWCTPRDGQDRLHNIYADPDRMGADRWLGLLGLLSHLRDSPAWQQGQPALLASFGTATTLDALMPAAHAGLPEFIGGLILPGPYLMAQSLAQGTAQLPLADGQPMDFPHNTHDAIASGIAAAQAGALLHQWHCLRRHANGRAPLVFCCGGGWPLIRNVAQADLNQALQALQRPAWTIPTLDSPVLDGLASLTSPSS